MEYFKLSEFKCKCCGKIPLFAEYNVINLVDNLLDPTRRVLGFPIYVNSGYRCPMHNARVGGVKTSQHLRGEAADLRCQNNQALIEVIKQIGDFDQLIIYKSFVHVSYKANGNNRRMVLDNRTGKMMRVSNLDIYEE